MCKLDEKRFHDADAAREYLEATLWPNGPVCPHCGAINNAYKAKRVGLYRCAEQACRADFTVTVGTVFERSKIPLNKWLLASFLLCSSKKGMSSHQLHRTLGVTYKTAWFMTHRIREAMRQTHTDQIGGAGKIVEADETYFGTENNKTMTAKAGAALKEMNKIVSLVERNGEVRSFHVASVNGHNLKNMLVKEVHKDSRLMTDSSPRYNLLKRLSPFASHEQVNHSKKEYARGDVTTNTVESYFSILKRGLIGTYHHVSSEHLKRYVSEFDFRYNHRESLGVNDAQRTHAVLKRISGKRLTYKRANSTA